MLISTLEPLEPWKMSNTPLFTPFLPLFCFGGIDWTNISKLKVLVFQNAIIHISALEPQEPYQMSNTPLFTPFTVLFPLYVPFLALRDLIGKISSS